MRAAHARSFWPMCVGVCRGVVVPPPRLYGIVAAAAPFVLLFSKARAAWTLFGWDLTRDVITPGAVFRGTIYPRRVDLSPDGTWLSAFLLKRTETYHVVSRAPWLHALALYREMGTWTRGYHFVPSAQHALGARAPDEGSVEALHRTWGLGLAPTAVAQYATELRHGFVPHASCPPRGPNDVWDEQRRVVLVKPRPGGRESLVLTDVAASTRDPRIEGRRPRYAIESRRGTTPLEGVTWADWDLEGRLVVATDEGRVGLREAPRLYQATREHDLASLDVTAAPAPAWARVY